MYYWTPKRIKELKAAGYKLHASPASLVKKSDQAISSCSNSTELAQRSPGPGQKPRYTPTGILLGVDLGDKPQAPSSKQQASSTKLIKQQAASIKPRG